MGWGKHMVMLLTLEIFILIIALTAFLIVKRREALQIRRQQERRAFTRNLPIQIVCGDCMGDEISPRRTFLGIYERCSHCGGSSYILASALAINMRVHHAEQALPMNAETTDSHVISFKEHLAAREDRNQKIAV